MSFIVKCDKCGKELNDKLHSTEFFQFVTEQLEYGDDGKEFTFLDKAINMVVLCYDCKEIFEVWMKK